MDEQKFKIEFDKLDRIANHMLLYVNEEPVAAGRGYLKPQEAGIYVVSRIAVRKPWRGRQLGTHMLRAFEQQARKLGAERLEVSAQLQAQDFYQRLGYVCQGQVYMDEHCPHIDMRKQL